MKKLLPLLAVSLAFASCASDNGTVDKSRAALLKKKSSDDGDEEKKPVVGPLECIDTINGSFRRKDGDATIPLEVKSVKAEAIYKFDIKIDKYNEANLEANKELDLRDPLKGKVTASCDKSSVSFLFKETAADGTATENKIKLSPEGETLKLEGSGPVAGNLSGSYEKAPL